MKQRQRHNDGTLDYGETAVPAAATAACFAVRRGLVPDSAIRLPGAPPTLPPARPPAPPVPESRTPSPGVAGAVLHHRAVITDSALARLVTETWHAAQAIAADPALLAALREQDPALASPVEALAHSPLDPLIDRARRQMRPLGPGQQAPGMRM